MLKKGILSVMEQTDQDIEHIFLVDREKVGIWEANQVMDRFKDQADGQYVYILDDDCRLIEPAFVATLRDFCEKNDFPDVIMVRSVRRQLAPPLLPKPHVWGDHEALRISTTNSLCYVAKNALWKEHIYRYGQKAAGDWFFLKSMRDSGASFGWLDLCVAETMQLGRGVRFEDVEGDWFGPVAQEFGIEEVARDDWRLRLWQADTSMTGEEVISVLDDLPLPPEDVQERMVRHARRQARRQVKRKKGKSLLERRKK